MKKKIYFTICVIHSFMFRQITKLRSMLNPKLYFLFLLLLHAHIYHESNIIDIAYKKEFKRQS